VRYFCVFVVFAVFSSSFNCKQERQQQQQSQLQQQQLQQQQQSATHKIVGKFSSHTFCAITSFATVICCCWFSLVCYSLYRISWQHCPNNEIPQIKSNKAHAANIYVEDIWISHS